MSSISFLTASQISNLTTSQIRNLSSADVKLLSTAQIAALSSAQIGAIETRDFLVLSSGQISAFDGSLSEFSALAEGQDLRQAFMAVLKKDAI